MIDFGFDKLALISAVALIVIGPEKLPRVARTVGTLLGKAQRYVADVKAEVNRSIELEELKKMKTEFEDAARNVEQTVSNEVHQTTRRSRQRLAAARRHGAAARQRQPVCGAGDVPASEEELAPEARRHAAVVQAEERHPRPGAVGRGARRALPADAAFMTPRSPSVRRYARGAAGLGAARRPAGPSWLRRIRTSWREPSSRSSRTSSSCATG